MAKKFDPKKYKVDVTPLSRLSRLSTEHLQSVLKYWSRISNNRYERMKALDPLYSYLLSVERGGKFGKSGVYKDRVAMISELQRIKNIAPYLIKKRLDEEAIALKGIYNDYSLNYEASHLVKIEDFRRAFALFKQKHLNVAPELYDKLRSVILKLHDRPIYYLEDVLERLYIEYQDDVVKRLDSPLPEDSQPW